MTAKMRREARDMGGPSAMADALTKARPLPPPASARSLIEELARAEGKRRTKTICCCGKPGCDLGPMVDIVVPD